MKSGRYDSERIAQTAGYRVGQEELAFDPGPMQCDGITDGVCFEHGGEGKFEGGWVVSYDDLMEMADLAKAARGQAGN